MWIRPLADADASCGAKAAGLARLIAAGARVPEGFVIDSRAFHLIAALDEVAPDAIGHALAEAGERIRGGELPAELEREVRDGAARLGRLAVRSSASIEDGALGAAAGVFASITDVAPADVWDAVRAVWTSALTPLAVAYARRRAAGISISVIVQRFVAGDRMTVYTRPAGAPGGTASPDEEMWLQREGRLERVRRSAAAGRAEAAIALAAEAAIEAPRGADVELVLEPVPPGARPADVEGMREPTSLGTPRDLERVREPTSLSTPADLERVREPTSLGTPADVEWVREPTSLGTPADVERVREPTLEGPRPADVDLMIESTPPGVRPWVVQARPILHPAPRQRPVPPPIVLAPLVQDGRRWTWDIAHNPDPLSPAQAGLVERVERVAAAPYAMRVCGGYLYTTLREPGLAPPVAPADRGELAAMIAAIEARFAVGETRSLASALDRYVGFMQIWAWELSPLVAAARRRLIDRLAALGHAPDRIAGLVAALVGPRRVLRDRVLSPAWDVAVPTFAEQPGVAVAAPSPDRPDAVAAEPSLDRRDASPPVLESGALRELTAEIELARAAADAAETDDLWFARAQWMVRRALLDRSAELGLGGDDIFWLPLDEVVTLRTLDADDAQRRASAARAAHRRAAEWDMPVVVHGSDVSRELPSAPRLVLRGVGLGPRVVGRVVRVGSFHTSAPSIGRGDVVVTRAVTPALAMIVEGCAALVSETGGLLDHGAALARELRITCVVGCAGAWAQLTDGAVISVDGDAGLVGLA